jgi:hypothetical protein
MGCYSAVIAGILYLLGLAKQVNMENQLFEA